MYRVKIPHIKNIYTVKNQLSIIIEFDRCTSFNPSDTDTISNKLSTSETLTNKIKIKESVDTAEVSRFNLIPKNVPKDNTLGFTTLHELSKLLSVQEVLDYVVSLIETNSDYEYEVPLIEIDYENLYYPYSSIFH